jgi:hypothetical protein
MLRRQQEEWNNKIRAEVPDWPFNEAPLRPKECPNVAVTVDKQDALWLDASGRCQKHLATISLSDFGGKFSAHIYI